MQAGEDQLLSEPLSQVSPSLQAYIRKELLIPCNLVPSVQSGGHTVLLDKCTPASASTVYGTWRKTWGCSSSPNLSLIILSLLSTFCLLRCRFLSASREEKRKWQFGKVLIFRSATSHLRPRKKRNWKQIYFFFLHISFHCHMNCFIVLLPFLFVCTVLGILKGSMTKQKSSIVSEVSDG